MIVTRMQLAALVVLCVLPGPSRAQKPEYTKLNLQPGLVLEIKGAMSDQGMFVATDVEELAKERRPKLRGAIQSIDKEKKTLVLFGRTVHVTDDTEFASEGGGTISFGNLQAGLHVELSCGVEENGRWIALKITGGAVKRDNKIKGTVTSVKADGVAPDTLEIHGLLILLDQKTDVNRPGDDEESELPVQTDMFRRTAFKYRRSLRGGLSFAGDNVHLGAEYRHNLRSMSDYDLSEPYRSDVEDTQPELRVNGAADWDGRLGAFAQLRLRKNYVLASDQDLSSDSFQADLTQLFVVAPDIGGTGLAVQVGRQEFDEPREWLFDEYLDAVRVYYHGAPRILAQAAFIPSVEPIKEKFDTWTDYFAMVSYFPTDENEVAGYVLARSDTSPRNREPVWGGLRYLGEIRMFRPWAEWAIMRGEDKGETLRAWAIDAGSTVRWRRVRLAPAFTVGYAQGSGDDTGADDVDHTFRQTGYEDNVDRFGGVASFHYYGSVLDPELSNLALWTLGAGIRPTPASSIDLVYHRYRQAEPDDDLEGSELVDPPARPNGESDDIGWGLDLVLGSPPFWNHLRVKWTLGLFAPGDAFVPRQETAYLSQFNLTLVF